MFSSHRSSRTPALSARFRAAILDHPSSPPRCLPLFRFTDCVQLPHTSSGTHKERKKDSKRTRFCRRASTSPLHNLIPTANLAQSHPESAPTNSFFLPTRQNSLSASSRLRASTVAFIRAKQSHRNPPIKTKN